MSSLRQFLFGYAEEKSVPQELAVYNTSTTSVIIKFSLIF